MATYLKFGQTSSTNLGKCLRRGGWPSNKAGPRGDQPLAAACVSWNGPPPLMSPDSSQNSDPASTAAREASADSSVPADLGPENTSPGVEAGAAHGGSAPQVLAADPHNDWIPTHFIALLMVLASLVMVLWNLQDASLNNANTGSRYATIESLVDFGTYHIDDSHYVHTIDKMKAGEHFISSKPPLLPTYGAGVYWVYKKLTGQTIGDYEGNVVRTVTLFTSFLAHAVFLVYLYRFCLLLFRRRLTSLVTLAAGCFSYLGVAYATAINNHSIGATIALVGLFHAYRAGRGSTGYKDWILAGFWFGIDGAIDLTCLAFLPTVGLYLLLKDWRRAVFGFGLATLPGLLCLGVLNYEITGSFKPAYSNSELKDFPENYFRHRRSGIDALREPKYLYAWNVLLGHHGVFSMTPLFGFGLYELVRRLKTRSYLRESLVVVGVFAAVFYFYIFRTRNYGGWCVGMRWLIPFMPMFLLYFGAWFDRIKLTKVALTSVALAFAVGCFHVQDGLTSPFQYSVWHNWLEGRPNRGRVGKTFNVSKAKSKPKAKAKRNPDAAH